MPTKRHEELPAGWKQPPETSADPVPLSRPYAPLDSGLLAGLLPPRPRFTPRPRPIAPAQAHAIPRQRCGDGDVAQPKAPPAPRRRGAPAMRQWRPMRAIIGDEICIPILWCEAGDCIERFSGSDALGEWHLRERALTAGWRYNAAGRLSCPACAQEDSVFWASRPPATTD